MKKESRILVAGAGTFIGAAVAGALRDQGYRHVVDDVSAGVALSRAAEVEGLFAQHAPEYVFLAAGKSGGIMANEQRPAELMLDNLLIDACVVSAAHRHGVAKLLYLASACCYPKHAEQPMRVESLLTGPLEPTSECYALAKIAGIKLCEAFRREHGDHFIAAIPANVFGPGDDFSPENAHVVAALIRRMHEAKQAGSPAVEIWGTGSPRREFVFVDDVADACGFLMLNYDERAPINIGGESECSIRELAETVKAVTGYPGRILFDETKPDGMPRKALDSAPLSARGWRPRFPFREALNATYQAFVAAGSR